ncbi:MAG: hypothetical protein SF069_09120 [Phycisphaerae bacterium]|nr:hypothetical protein [Phycisphaerae bacterium]
MSKLPPSQSPAPLGLLRFTLSGLPELELFESDAQRDAALHRLATKSGDPSKRGWWQGFVVLLPMVIVIWFLMRYARTLVIWPSWIEEGLSFFVLLAAAALVARWLHRGGAARELREQLLLQGVPVCRGCGYSLRGQLEGAQRCPECGREIDADAAALIGRTSRAG